MITQEAIKKAVEGGFEQYKGFDFNGFNLVPNSDLVELIYSAEGGDTTKTISIQEILLYPQFWQCLGKAMGWTDNHISQGFPHYGKQWHFEWHRLINCLAEGKTIEDYFKQLR